MSRVGEPCLWAHVVERDLNPPIGTVRRGERLPRAAHAGDYEHPTEHPLADRRFVRVLRHDGHEVALALGSGAGDLSGKGTQRKAQLAKARHFGWLRPDECAIRQVKSGGIRPESLLTWTADAKVCSKDHDRSKPCPHYLAEREARQAANAKREQDVADSFKSHEQRAHEQTSAAAAAAVARELAPLLAKLSGGK